MEVIQPTEQNERAIIVDIVRGLALVGVLFANFTSYSDQNVPGDVLNTISTPIDKMLSAFNTIFIEWKFMTIFSVLFGYGFGLILISLEKKSINPVPFFLRRMGWLFVFGLIHSLFWWGDVLNFYCISGALLLLFRKFSPDRILIASVVFMFIATPFTSWLLRAQPEYFTDEHIAKLYEHYKRNNIINIFKANLVFYYFAFIKSGANLHDIIETLGRFLLGYYLVRIRLFDQVERKKTIFLYGLLVSMPLTIGYFLIRWMILNHEISPESIFFEPLIKLGILSASCSYVCTTVLLFIKFGNLKLFGALQALGKMTLTNYLLISGFSVLLLYGIGFGKLGEIPMKIIWVFAFIWLLIEIIFSIFWLKKYRFGLAEWIWRQLTYQQFIPLRRDKNK